MTGVKGLVVFSRRGEAGDGAMAGTVRRLELSETV